MAFPTLEDRCELADRLSTTNTERVLLSKEEAATLAGKSVRYMEELAAKKKGPPALRIGHRTVRYRASDVLHWIDSLTAQH
jgi:predicted DNA-binding transcriptional regulator AlpA